MKEWDLGLPYFQTNSRVLLGIETKNSGCFPEIDKLKSSTLPFLNRDL